MYEYYCSIRDSLGLTDYKVSKLTGIGQSTFSDWKAGRSAPKQEKLQKIAGCLGVSVEYLQTGKFPKRLSSSGGVFYFSDDSARLAQRLTANARLYDLMDAFEKLNDEGQALICNMVSGLVGNPAYISGRKRRSSGSVIA